MNFEISASWLFEGAAAALLATFGLLALRASRFFF